MSNCFFFTLNFGYFNVLLAVRLFAFIACRLLEATNVTVADSEEGSCDDAALQLSPTSSEVSVTKTAAAQALHDDNAGVSEFSLVSVVTSPKTVQMMKSVKTKDKTIFHQYNKAFIWIIMGIMPKVEL
jgi:hypothetical protein